MWLEKVDKLCSIDCSSPMSAKIWSKIPTRLPLSAKIGRPDCAMSWAKPKVFSIIVFPPVLGPVMTISVKSDAKYKSLATAFSIKGWVTWSRRISLLSDSIGTTAPLSCIKHTFARTRSKCPIIQALLAISAIWGRIRSDNSCKIRRISWRSSACALVISSLRLTTALGSIYTVFPLAEISCTTPEIRLRNVFLTGKTLRPFRLATTWSTNISPFVLRISCKISLTWTSFSWIFRRMRAKLSLAKLSTNPPSLIACSNPCRLGKANNFSKRRFKRCKSTFSNLS